MPFTYYAVERNAGKIYMDDRIDKDRKIIFTALELFLLIAVNRC